MMGDGMALGSNEQSLARPVIATLSRGWMDESSVESE